MPDLPSRDSRFEKLLELLHAAWAEDAKAKILIFTIFVGTAKYLTERLRKAGYPTLWIAGEVRSDPRHPELDELGNRLRQLPKTGGFVYSFQLKWVAKAWISNSVITWSIMISHGIPWYLRVVNCAWNAVWGAAAQVVIDQGARLSSVQPWFEMHLDRKTGVEPLETRRFDVLPETVCRLSLYPTTHE